MPKIASVNISTAGLQVHPYSAMVLCFIENRKKSENTESNGLKMRYT
jgi:hypothetical protein